MAYLLSNICTKNYWNRTTIVEIIVGGWVASFFETQCSCLIAAHIAWSNVLPGRLCGHWTWTIRTARTNFSRRLRYGHRTRTRTPVRASQVAP